MPRGRRSISRMLASEMIQIKTMAKCGKRAPDCRYGQVWIGCTFVPYFCA
jgi:hypothetical protein